MAETHLMDMLNLTNEQKDDVMSFIEDNFDSLREISLRTVIKLAQLRKATNERWHSMAQSSMLKSRIKQKSKEDIVEEADNYN